MHLKLYLLRNNASQMNSTFLFWINKTSMSFVKVTRLHSHNILQLLIRSWSHEHMVHSWFEYPLVVPTTSRCTLSKWPFQLQAWKKRRSHRLHLNCGSFPHSYWKCCVAPHFVLYCLPHLFGQQNGLLIFLIIVSAVSTSKNRESEAIYFRHIGIRVWTPIWERNLGKYTPKCLFE